VKVAARPVCVAGVRVVVSGVAVRVCHLPQSYAAPRRATLLAYRDRP
jgi:hypothetical protein